MNVFTSVMSIINSIYLWCVFSLFFCHQKQGHREEREIKRVRKRERKKKEGVLLWAFRDSEQLS